MKRLVAIITLITLIVLALPASAATTGTIDWHNQSPAAVRDQDTNEVVDGGLRYQIVGQFFHVVFPDGSEASTEIPKDATRYSLEGDGTVTFTIAEEPQPAPEPKPLIADVSAEEWDEYVEEHPEEATRYRSAGVYPF